MSTTAMSTTADLERQPQATASPPAAATRPHVRDIAKLTHDVLADAAGTMVTRRASATIAGDPRSPLRQTIVGLMDSQTLTDDACSQIATLQVLHGRVVLVAEGLRTLLQRGEWVTVPPVPHRLESVGDAAVLITTAGAGHSDEHHTAFVP